MRGKKIFRLGDGPEMEGYCKSDVALLQAGCEAFCKQFSDIAKFNPMAHCVTIASACNLYWRGNNSNPTLLQWSPYRVGAEPEWTSQKWL